MLQTVTMENGTANKEKGIITQRPSIRAVTSPAPNHVCPRDRIVIVATIVFVAIINLAIASTSSSSIAANCQPPIRTNIPGVTTFLLTHKLLCASLNSNCGHDGEHVGTAGPFPRYSQPCRKWPSTPVFTL